METTLKILISLQDCDTLIKDLKRKFEEGPAKIKALEEDLRQVEKQVEEELSLHEVFDRQRRQIEQQIEVVENKIDKSNIKLSNIKSNKEYSAALKEIDDLEKQKSLEEDRLLEIMEQAEALETKRAASKVKLAESRSWFEKEYEIIQQELAALDLDLERAKEMRDHIRNGIDTDLLKQYDYIAEHKGGIAISPVIKGVCQICHMGIPPQKFNELMRCDALMRCPSCMRIVYWGEDERFRNNVKTDEEGMSE